MKQRRLARGLYLLALLQLVGGPAILCGIALLVKFTANPPVSGNAAAGWCVSSEGHDLAAVVADLLPFDNAGSGKAKSSPSSKTKNAVGKLLLAGDNAPTPFLFVMSSSAPPNIEARLIPIPAHAPPAPPPRLA